MEFSLRTIRQYQKYVRSKRSMDSSLHLEPESDQYGSNSINNKLLGVQEHSQLKSYHDSHIFKATLSSIQNPKDLSAIFVISRQKTESGAYESYSKRRDTKKIYNASYQLQKTQKSIKTQRALEDLNKISQISIQHFERNPQSSIRFNKQVEALPKAERQDKPFRRWRTMSKEKSRKSNSPIKNHNSPGKRAKNSPTKIKFNLRIRRTFNNAKTSSFALNLSTIESSNLSEQNSKPTRRKSSITPWETEQEGLL